MNPANDNTFNIIRRLQTRLVSDVELSQEEWRGKLMNNAKSDLHHGFLERTEFDYTGKKFWVYDMFSGELADE